MHRARPTSLSALLETPSELTDGGASKSAVVLMTRVRLARNLNGYSFPGWAKASERENILRPCRDAVSATVAMRPWARRAGKTAPAKSTCAITQPPKISPL